MPSPAAHAAKARKKLKKGFGRRLRQRRIVLVGLDGAGKTTIMRQLTRKPGEPVAPITDTRPTIGFNSGTTHYRVGEQEVELSVFDVGGQARLRELWPQYCHGTDGLVVVVDSSDHERAAELHKALRTLMTQEPKLLPTALLVLANKQDQPNALTPPELIPLLCLDTFTEPTMNWHVEGTVGIDGTGLEQAFDWLARCLLKPKRSDRAMSALQFFCCCGRVPAEGKTTNTRRKGSLVVEKVRITREGDPMRRPSVPAVLTQRDYPESPGSRSSGLIRGSARLSGIAESGAAAAGAGAIPPDSAAAAAADGGADADAVDASGVALELSEPPAAEAAASSGDGPAEEEDAAAAS